MSDTIVNSQIVDDYFSGAMKWKKDFSELFGEQPGVKTAIAYVSFCGSETETNSPSKDAFKVFTDLVRHCPDAKMVFMVHEIKSELRDKYQTIQDDNEGKKILLKDGRKWNCVVTLEFESLKALNNSATHYGLITEGYDLNGLHIFPAYFEYRLMIPFHQLKTYFPKAGLITEEQKTISKNSESGKSAKSDVESMRNYIDSFRKGSYDQFIEGFFHMLSRSFPDKECQKAATFFKETMTDSEVAMLIKSFSGENPREASEMLFEFIIRNRLTLNAIFEGGIDRFLNDYLF